MKILSYKDVNVDFSEELIEATKVLGANFWYKKRIEKIAALNTWVETFNREMEFNIPVKFALQGSCAEFDDNHFDGMNVGEIFESVLESIVDPTVIYVPKVGKVSLVTSIFYAVVVGMRNNITESGSSLLDATTAEVIDTSDLYHYIGFTARAYALNLYRVCFPEKYEKAIDPGIENIRLLIR